MVNKLLSVVASFVLITLTPLANSVPWDPSVDGLHNPGENGVEIFTLTDTDGISDDLTGTLLIERAGYAEKTIFGIYDIATMDMLEIFSGSDAPGGIFPTSKTISWDNSGQVSIAGSVGVSIDSSRFGFYITTPQNNGYTYYSEAAKNPDNGIDHLLTYHMNGLDGFDYLLAWEDLYGGGDQDFNDIIVGVKDVSAIPLPTAVWLFGSGLIGLVGMARRKKV